jgi:hypothetical protein
MNRQRNDCLDGWAGRWMHRLWMDGWMEGIIDGMMGRGKGR